MAFGLRHNATIHVNLLRQCVIAGAMPIATLHRETNRRHNLPLTRRKRVLLHRIQIPKDRTVPENGIHLLGVRLLCIVPRRHQGGRMPSGPQRTTHLEGGVARLHLNRDILPGLGGHIERPHFIAHALVLDHTAVHDDLVTVHDGGRTEASFRLMRIAGGRVHRFPDVPVEVVRVEQIRLAVRLAGNDVQRVTPNGGSV